MVILNKILLLFLFLAIVIVPGVCATTSLTATPSSGPAPLAVQLRYTSPDCIIEGETWDFGDGSRAYQKTSWTNPDSNTFVFNDYIIHVYNIPGHTYTVSLKTYGTTAIHYGCGDTSQTTITVIPATPPPPPSFTMSPTSGKVPLNVHFTGLSSSPPTDWQWTGFQTSLGAKAQQQDFTYTFSAKEACNYGTTGIPISLGIINNSPIYGSSGIHVNSPVQYLMLQVDPSPVSSFTATPSSGPAPLTVQFSDASTNAPNAWSWTFGDGSSSTQQNPTHTYTISGVYSPALKATSSNSCNLPSNLPTTTITVLSPLSPTTVTTSQMITTNPTTTTIVPSATVTAASTTVPTTGQTTVVTTVPTTSQTTITTVTPKPTATVNYSATIAAMQSQIAEQNAKITEQGNILDQITNFLRTLFGWK